MVARGAEVWYGRKMELEIRDLMPADVALLGTGAAKPPPIKKILQRHHALARCLAAGMTQHEAGLATGYSDSRVSILMDDPTFLELVDLYRRDVDTKFQDMQERLLGLSIDAIDELHERLESNPASLSSAMLLQIVEKTADRSGNGPSTTQNVNVNVNMASRLEAARKRIAQEQARIIEGEVEDAELDEG